MATEVSTTFAEAIFRLLTLKMASVQVVKAPFAKSSPSQDSSHIDFFLSRYVTPGFKPFS